MPTKLDVVRKLSANCWQDSRMIQNTTWNDDENLLKLLNWWGKLKIGRAFGVRTL